LAPVALASLLIYSFRGPEAGGEALTVLMEPDGTNTWRALVERFNGEFPGAPVRIVEGPASTDSREDMYATSFLGGEAGFDIVYMDVVWVAKFAAAGWLADLSARISADDRRAFFAADLEGGSYQGNLYRMPALTDAGVLYYRPDLVSEPPETFAELLELARRHQTPERWGYLWQGKQYEGLVTVFLEVLWGHGGDWIVAGPRRVLLDSPEAIRAVEFLKGTIGTVSPPAVTTYAEEDTRSVFQNGRAVFLRNWPYVWTLARQSAGSVEIAMAPMPHAPGGPPRRWAVGALESRARRPIPIAPGSSSSGSHGPRSFASFSSSRAACRLGATWRRRSFFRFSKQRGRVRRFPNTRRPPISCNAG
jgi:multiple sugar transport system substrate-binding protein